MEMKRWLRRACVGIAVMLLSATLQVPSAQASETVLCSGFADCAQKGYPDHGWPAHLNDGPWLTYPGHNCTGYSAYVLDEVNGATHPGGALGDAKDWDDYARSRAIPVDHNPVRGSIAQWDAGQGRGSAGHVAYVEEVGSDYILVSEDVYPNGPFAWRRINKPASGWAIDFIHFKDLDQVGEVPWSFETLEGDANAVSPHSSNTGKTPAAIEFNGKLFVFSYDTTNGNLRYAWTVPQSPGWLFDILDGANGGGGRIGGNVGQVPEVVEFNNKLHVFYYDATNGNLRHAWSSNGASWNFETLEGDANSVSGHGSNVGQTPTATVHGGVLQLFYYESSTGNLRHAWKNSSGWNFETLDGDSNSIAGFSANLGQDPTVVTYGTTLQLFYYDTTNGNLRHAWANSSGWHFENLDGDSNSIGGLNANVGGNPTAIVFQNALHAFYYDKTHADLRHMWSDASGWHTEKFEGDANSISGFSGSVGTMTAAVVEGAVLQLVHYEAGGGNLRHGWANSSGWHFENLDGAGGTPDGRLNANVGQDPVVMVFGGKVHTFYYDGTGGNLRHTWSQ
jgi:surface antigen